MRAALLMLVTLLVGCRSTDEQWSFSVTRAVVESSSDSYSGYASRDSGLSGGVELLPIVLLPIALDVVVLPITLPRDLFFAD